MIRDARLSLDRTYSLVGALLHDDSSLDVTFEGVEIFRGRECFKFAGRVHHEIPEPAEIYFFYLKDGAYIVDSDGKTIIPHGVPDLKINRGDTIQEKREYETALSRLRRFRL